MPLVINVAKLKFPVHRIASLRYVNTFVGIISVSVIANVYFAASQYSVSQMLAFSFFML